MFRRDALKKRAVKNNSPTNWKAYRKLKNELDRTIKKTKRDYFINKINEDRKDIKNTWKVLNAAMNKSTKVIHIDKLKVNDDDITDSNEIVNLFNKHFVNIGPSLTENLPTPNHDSVEVLIEKPNSFKF